MLWNYFPQTKYAKVRPGNCARDWLTTSSSRATSGLVGRAKGADRQPARERFSIPGSAFEVNPTPRGETCLRLYRAASAGPWPDRPLRPGECLSERVNSWQGRELPGASLWGYSVETRCWSRVWLTGVVFLNSLLLGGHHRAGLSPWFAPVMTLKTSAPLRYELLSQVHCMSRVFFFLNILDKAIKGLSGACTI